MTSYLAYPALNNKKMDKNTLKSILSKSLILSGAFLFVAIFVSLSGLGLLKYPAALVLPAGAGTIDTTDRYAYSENAGWIDFGSTQGVVGVGNSELTGYAWGENIGWISLNCSNDNSCLTVDYKVKNDGGSLSGYAYSENTGWINFSPTLVPANLTAKIDSNGYFTGYIWGENIGWVSLNCSNGNSCLTVDYKVRTTWRIPKNATGSLPQSPFASPTAPEGGFSFTINNGAADTNSLNVTLNIKGSSDTARIAISNDPALSSSSQEQYQTEKQWTLTEGEGQKTVYIKFYNSRGIPSDTVTATINYKKSASITEEITNIVTPTPISIPKTPASKPTLTPATPQQPPSGVQPNTPPPTTPNIPNMQQTSSFVKIVQELVSIIRNFFLQYFIR